MQAPGARREGPRLTGPWRWIDALAFHGYAWFLILPGGLLGLLIPRWGPLPFEVYARGVFDADLPEQVLASALNQYRYMKSMEFGFGVFSVCFRDFIYTDRRFNRFFLGIIFLGAAERALSVVLDGMPRPFYVAAIFIELSVGLIVFISTRRTLRAASPAVD
ncbi:DUF4345 domain-containing protein [Corallococcus sp. BB11-1]|uniref:DUF4345 domain-containing protein n=1 Tax=Corallococcus sp. BB11-1 TaxID=2996783 RepID=UPI0022712168|nr:DUF4345 domain-containing protein [Corallococcus sp. BB11-1]MCY1035925.1 DUF4345 domain-containing protein [Corallococcus sp. BB11-1]